MAKETRSVSREMTVMPKDKWDKNQLDLKKEGDAYLKSMLVKGSFEPQIIGPSILPAGAQAQLTAVIVANDWKAKHKLNLIDLVNDFMQGAYFLGLPLKGVGDIFKAVIEEQEVNVTRE